MTRADLKSLATLQPPLSTLHSPLTTLHSSLGAVLLLLAAQWAFAETPTAVPVEGEPFLAEISAIDGEWVVAFGSGNQRRTMSAADLGWWGECVDARRGPLLVMGDGSLVVADVFRADKEQLEADSELFGLVKVPLDLLSGVVFQLPSERHSRDLLLDRVASAAGESDQVILANGDEVSGRIEAIEDQTVRLDAAVGPVDVQTHRITALVFNPALLRRAEHKGLRAIAGFRDGSRLVADRLAVNGDSLEINVAGARKWAARREDLVYLQPLGGRVAYLSDIKAADYRHVPFLDLSWPYRTDRNVTGGLLRSGGRLYLKGLGMHSAARLTYQLAEPYTRFQAEAAIDDATGGRGSVRFRLFVDGTEKHTSQTIRGGQAPVPISVDLNGAKRLDLVIDFADRADELDHANWLNARLVRRSEAADATSHGGKP